MANEPYSLHVSDWHDLCAGLALLYLGPTSESDELIACVKRAMVAEDVNEMDHLSAVLLGILKGRGKDISFSSNRWRELDDQFHRQFCLWRCW